MPMSSVAPLVGGFYGRLRNLPGPLMGGTPPTLTAVYDDTNGRVLLSASGAPPGTVSVHFERSRNNVTWIDVRGGQAVPVAGTIAQLYDYEYSAGVLNYYRETFLSASGATLGQTVVTVTPVQTGVWLKNPVRPYLNVQVVVTGLADVTRQSRSGTFDVKGRTPAVAVTDLMSGRSTTLTFRTVVATAADTLESMLAVGEVVFVHPPYQAATPTMYALPTGMTRSQVAATSAHRLFPTPLTEVAQPSLTLAAVQSTWQTVVNTYATWQDLLNAKPTWNDVLNIVGSAADIITT